MPRPVRLAAVLLIAAVAAPSASRPAAAAEPAPRPPIAPPSIDDSERSAPAAAAPAVGFTPLTPRTRMVYRTVDKDGDETVEDWTVLEETTFNGRRVTPLRSGDVIQLLDSATGNWIATMRGEGDVEEARPDRGVFVWPLEVGNTWMAEFTYHDRASDFSVGPIGTLWTVEAWEPVTTPAGTFPAMRLRGEPKRNNTRRTLLWYAPDPGMIVRRRVVQATGEGNERATVTWELIDYGPH